MNISSRPIPGTIKVEGREFCYISDDGNNYFTRKSLRSKKLSLFDKVTSQFGFAQSGGVISENCRIWLPTGELFHGLSYKGDIEGWRKEIELSTTQLNLLTAVIVENNIKLSDERIYALFDCEIEFY